MLLAGLAPAPPPVRRIPRPPERSGEIPSFARDVPAIRSGEPIFRFNGKDLDGFYPYVRDRGRHDPNKVFTVRDGMICVSGQEFGGLTTRDEFHDYHLVVEWKWGERTWAPRKNNTRDSGILVHCVGDRRRPRRQLDGVAGVPDHRGRHRRLHHGRRQGEAEPHLRDPRRPGRQLYFEKGGKAVTRDSGRFNWWGRDPSWKDVLGFRGARDVEKPAGEWNRMEVVCDGDSITTILNGYVVNMGTKSSLTRGKILFQSEGAEILFRKIEVRPLIR